jgi:type I restriction enzyme S subunit
MSDKIPEGWDIKKLNDVATLIMGQSPKSNTYNQNKNGMPFFQGKADFDVKYPIIRHWSTSPTKIAPVNSILFSVRAPVGDVNLNNVEACIGRGLASILGTSIDNIFLYQSLIYLKVKFEMLGQGSTFEAINGNELKNFPLVCPPLLEQKKIASILTSVDEVIENTQKKINKLQNLKKATINDLFSKGIDHREFKNSKLGRIPKSWKIATMQQLIKKVVDNRGKTPPLSNEGRELIEVVSISKLHRFLDYNLAKKRVSEETYKTWFRNGHPKIGDILVPTVGLIGECSIVSEDRGCIAQNVVALRCSEDLLSNYLYWLMYSKYVLSEIGRVFMGAVQPSLKVPHLLDSLIPIPPIDEQRKIFETLNGIENTVIDNQKKIVSFKHLKKSLMQDLLTGKVRVQVN